jgi:beta-N-acetylhexosaminidase
MGRQRVFGAALLLVSGLVFAVGDANAATSPSNLDCAVQVVSKWTLLQQANETVVVSVNAMNLGGMVPAARAGYGGLLLLGSRAPSVIATTLTALQRMTPNHYPMMVMTDEEGGGVMRLNNLVAPFPWPQTMGATMTPYQITTIGQRVGSTLNSLGVNTDLAPVLDLDARAVWPGATNPDGMRSFGAAPLKASVDAIAFMKGLAQANVTAVVKHFPGLGGSSGNTDYGPATTKPWATLQSTALIPFERAIASGVTAIMLSNAIVPGLTTLPASLSPAVISVLRTTLGFQGLIMTDSLSAGAIGVLGQSGGAAAVRALQAGADQILFNVSNSVSASLAAARSISSAILSAVKGGTLSQATLEAAAAQVLAARSVLTCTTSST